MLCNYVVLRMRRNKMNFLKKKMFILFKFKFALYLLLCYYHIHICFISNILYYDNFALLGVIYFIIGHIYLITLRLKK